jgi:hypothetical protein
LKSFRRNIRNWKDKIKKEPLLNPSINIIYDRTGGLSIDRFSVRHGEAWCIFGLTHSGVHEFFRRITREMPDMAGKPYFRD